MKAYYLIMAFVFVILGCLIHKEENFFFTGSFIFACTASIIIAIENKKDNETN